MAGIAFGLFDWVDRQDVPLELRRDLTAAQSLRSLRFFADEVLPVFAR